MSAQTLPQTLLGLSQEMDHVGRQLLDRWDPELARRFTALSQCLQGVAEQAGADRSEEHTSNSSHSQQSRMPSSA